MSEISLHKQFLDFANVFKAFIGSSYLAMPFAFHQSGILVGLIMMLILGFLNDYCCIVIVKCKTMIIERLMEQFEQKLESGILPELEADLVRSGRLKSRWEDRMTLSHIAKYVFGKKGQWIVTICLFISQFGFCTCYMIFVGTTVYSIIPSSKNYTDNQNLSIVTLSSSQDSIFSKLPLTLFVIIPVPIYIFFALLRSLRKMGSVSMLANFTVFFGYFSILISMLIGFQLSDSFKMANFTTLAVVFGMLTSAFEGIGMVIPIESSMIGNRHNFSRYLHATVTIIIFILGSFGIVGNLRYGDGTKQIILENLPETIFVTILKFILILSVLLTYPLQMYPVVEIAEFIFFRKRSSELLAERLKQSNTNENKQENQAAEFNDDEIDIVAELSASESESDSEEYNRKMRKRSYGKKRNQILDNASINDYGTTNDNKIINSTSSVAVIINSDTDKSFTKKQERMIRIVYGSKITAAAWKRNIIRVGLVMLQLGLAILMRYNYAYLTAIIGAVGSSFLAYILPAATHYKLLRNSPVPFYIRWSDILIVFIGVVGSIASFVVTIIEFINPT